MKPYLRLLLTLTGLSLCASPLAAAAEFPAIRLGGIEPEPAVTFPPLRLTIPKYRFTAQEREVVATCLILEAACQGDYGMRGVMSVIRNRARGLPELYTQVVLRPKQFSALNPITTGHETFAQAVNRAKRDRMWPVALSIVEDSLQDTWYDSTGGATHYTRAAERTPWTRRLAKTVTIGAHSFYR